jgi:hypothetical protein
MLQQPKNSTDTVNYDNNAFCKRSKVKNDEILLERITLLLDRLAIDEDVGIHFDELKYALIQQ